MEGYQLSVISYQFNSSFLVIKFENCFIGNLLKTENCKLKTVIFGRFC